MNDFSEIENELRKLRPAQPAAGLIERVRQGLDESIANDDPVGKVIRPDRFRRGWIPLGLGLAAAAVLLILARIDFRTAPPAVSNIASATPAFTPAPQLASAQFIPAGATRVVYHTQDEGLLFPGGSAQPVRRVRSRTRETLQWHNPSTGASLRVSYPSEEVQLIPVAGH